MPDIYEVISESVVIMVTLGKNPTRIRMHPYLIRMLSAQLNSWTKTLMNQKSETIPLVAMLSTNLATLIVIEDWSVPIGAFHLE